MALNFTDVDKMIEEGQHRVALVVRPKLEPETNLLPYDLAAQASLAISMKRIADFICGSHSNQDIVDYTSDALRAVLRHES